MQMKIHLRKRKLTGKGHSKAGYSLYLDIYYRKGNRKREYLGIYFEPTDTKTNRDEKQKLAESIKAKRLIELINEEQGISSKLNMQMSFVGFYREQMTKRIPSTRVPWEYALQYIQKYSTKELRFADINKKWLDDFTACLLKHVSPLSASLYISKIKCVIHEAEREGIIPFNPNLRTLPIKIPDIVRDYLSIEEIHSISNAVVKKEYQLVKNAFLFSCFTGLRFGDLKSLKWNQIKEVALNANEKVFTIQKVQGKTGAVNYIPLNETALKIIGQRPENDSLVFPFKQVNATIRKVLYRILEAAKIDKKITFHSGRRTYATLLLAQGANIMTVKELLGHKDLSSTMLYAKVLDSSKYSAVNSLPQISNL
jgi:integrase